MDESERLSRLEERVARLESGPVPVPSADVFWALEGLKVHSPDAVLFTGSVTLPTGERYEWQMTRPAQELLDDDWSQQIATLSALAHPVRLLLLREVLHGARSNAELSAHEQLGTTGQLYHHLRQLVAAGWLRNTARGQYEVPGERVVPLLAVLAAARR